MSNDYRQRVDVGATSPEWATQAKPAEKSATRPSEEMSSRASRTSDVASQHMPGHGGSEEVNVPSTPQMLPASSAAIENTTATKATPQLTKANVDSLISLVKNNGIVEKKLSLPTLLVGIRTAWNKQFSERYQLMRDHGNELVSLMARSGNKGENLDIKDRVGIRNQAVKARGKLEKAIQSHQRQFGVAAGDQKLARMDNMLKLYNSFIDDNENKILEKEASNTFGKLEAKIKYEGSKVTKSSEYNDFIKDLRGQLDAAKHKTPVAPGETIKAIETKLHEAIRLKAKRVIKEKDIQLNGIPGGTKKGIKKEPEKLKEGEFKAAIQEMDDMLKELEGTGSKSASVRELLTQKRSQFIEVSPRLDLKVHNQCKFSQTLANYPEPNDKSTRIANGKKFAAERGEIERQINKLEAESEYFKDVVDKAVPGIDKISPQVHLDVGKARLAHLKVLQKEYVALQVTNNHAIYKTVLQEIKDSFAQHKGEDLEKVAAEYLKLSIMLKDAPTMAAHPEMKKQVEDQIAIYKAKLASTSPVEQKALAAANAHITSIVARASVATNKVEGKAWYQKNIIKGWKNLTGRGAKPAEIKLLNVSIDAKNILLKEMDALDKEVSVKVEELKKRFAVLESHPSGDIEAAQLQLQLEEYKTLQQQVKDQMLSTTIDILETSLKLAGEGYPEDVFVLRDALARANQLLAKFPPPDQDSAKLLDAKRAAFLQIGSNASNNPPVSFAQQIMLMSWEAGDQMALDKLRGASIDPWAKDLMLKGVDISSVDIKKDMYSGLGRSKELQAVVADACMKGEPWALKMLGSAMETKGALLGMKESAEKTWAKATMGKMWPSGAKKPIIQSTMAQLCKENQTTADMVHSMLDRSDAEVAYKVITKLCQASEDSVANMNEKWVKEQLVSDLGFSDPAVKARAQQAVIEMFKSGGQRFLQMVTDPNNPFIKDPVIQQGIRKVITTDLKNMPGAEKGGMIKPRLEWALKNVKLAGGADAIAGAIKACVETKHQKTEDNFTPGTAKKLLQGAPDNIKNHAELASIDDMIVQEKIRLGTPLYAEVITLYQNAADAVSYLLENETVLRQKYGLDNNDIRVIKQLDNLYKEQNAIIDRAGDFRTKFTDKDAIANKDDIENASQCFEKLVENESKTAELQFQYVQFFDKKIKYYKAKDDDDSQAIAQMSSFAIKPTQTVMRVPLLAGQMVSSSPDEGKEESAITKSLNAALTQASEYADSVNLQKAEAELQEKVLSKPENNPQQIADKKTALKMFFDKNETVNSAKELSPSNQKGIDAFVRSCCKQAKPNEPPIWKKGQIDYLGPVHKARWYATVMNVPQAVIQRMKEQVAIPEAQTGSSETEKIAFFKDLIATREQLDKDPSSAFDVARPEL